MERHIDLVESVAYRVLGSLPPGRHQIEFEELVQVGVIALFEADGNFDGTRGHSFASYAEFRVQGAMLDELRRQDFFPRRLRQKANRLEKSRRKLRRSLGRRPRPEEIAEDLEISIEKLRTLQRDVQPYSFVPEDEPGLSLRCERPDAFSITARRERHGHVVEALQRLDDREQLVIDLYYRRDLTLREIAEVLDLTEGRISQIKSATVAKLRQMLVDA